MVFSSIIFLYFFLPLTLLLYFMVDIRARNIMLLLASLFFYTWGETGYVLVLLFSIMANYIIGLILKQVIDNGKSGKIVLSIGLVINILPLVFFKYTSFLLNSVFSFFPSEWLLDAGKIHLPIGISFFTFQAISYLVDIYRKDAIVQRNPISLALYISLFPQLIAGPIVRYHDIYNQLSKRKVSLTDFQKGILRFITGLGKKVLIANNIGAVSDHIFSLPATELPATLAWIGAISYTLQIYYDFSGYSDMAIGLGRMFGFRFLENFNYPYISRSVREFWRRWHISLSSWFRDYLYIPLGGNRSKPWRTYLNLVTVFFLCGLWHGASWTFVLWGLFHGLFLVLERSRFGEVIKWLPGWAQYCYTMLVVIVGWILFRCENITHALDYIRALAHVRATPYIDAKLFSVMNNEFYVVLLFGLLFATPFIPKLNQKIDLFIGNRNDKIRLFYKSAHGIILASWVTLIITYSSAVLISGSHNPFLYFRF